MVYLPVNAIGLPLSFLLRPGFLLLGRRERVLGESEDVLCIHGRGFEKFPRIRASDEGTRQAVRVPATCGPGVSSEGTASDEGSRMRRGKGGGGGVEGGVARDGRRDGMNKVRFIEPCVVEKRKKYRQKTKIFCLLILTYPNPIPALEWVSLPTGDSSGGPQLRPMKVNAGGGWGVDGEKGVGGIGIGGLSHGPSVGACRGAHLSGLYAEICLIFASFDVRI
ncbi:hypothetical protein BHM03_00016424 [Ensete ventricosum]|nr:hypothetical protein BHM03_00016424 [Ensete ventricosum]